MNGDCVLHGEKIDRIEKSCEVLFDKLDKLADKAEEIRVIVASTNEKVKSNSASIKTIYAIILGSGGIAGVIAGVLKIMG